MKIIRTNIGWFPLRKISIELDWTFFHLVSSARLDQKKLKILQLFIIRVANHRFKLEQKIVVVFTKFAINAKNSMNAAAFIRIITYFHHLMLMC